MPADVIIFKSKKKPIQRSIDSVHVNDLYFKLTHWLYFPLIFLKLCIKLGGLKGQKLTDKAKFSNKKNAYFEKAFAEI